MFRIFICKTCGERYDATGMEGVTNFLCTGCGRRIQPGVNRFPALFGDLAPPRTPAHLLACPGPGTLRSRIGPYQVIDEVARGGMGVVYQCKHAKSGRIVALKVLASPRRGGKNMVQRFRHEARTARSCDHPNIIPIYDIGHTDGLHYFSMKYVEGLTLDFHFERDNLPLTESVEWLVSMCDALDYLHQRGVVHRDIKPGNIMISDDGSAHLIDFGLAKIMDAPRHLTRPGMAMGTPAYMSPEQAEGERRIDGRADIYSLGAVLFELITGHPPFKGESLMETMLLVVSDSVPSLRQHKPDVDPRLEAICLKALQKSRNRRYQTARALGEDLKRYLAGKPVSARPQTLREKMIDNINRYKVPGLLVMASVAGGFATLASVLALAGRL